MDYSLIIKLTNDCNLNCAYCYHRRDANRDFKAYLSRENISLLIEKILEHNAECAEFIWHGGEPLLTGLDTFRFIVDAQRRLNAKGLKILNRVQTNGTLLTKEAIDFFHEHDIDVGISIDGPFDLHAAKRGTYTSEYETILQSLDQLHACGAHYGILCVVGKQHIGQARRIYELMNAHNIRHVGFLPCLVHNDGVVDTSLTIAPREYGQFLIDFFETWIHGTVHGMHIRNIDDCIRFYRDKPAKTCINTNSCDRYLTVLPDGNIYLCDNFSASGQHQVSTIQNGFDGIPESAPMRWLKQAMETVPRSCQSCPYYLGCYSGCKYRRWVRDPEMKQGHYYCLSTRMLFDHVGRYLTKKEHE